VAGLRAGAFLATFALAATVLRAVLLTCFFAGFVFALLVLLVTFRAFLAGAFTAETLFEDLGRADFGLRVLLLLVTFVAERRLDVRLIPFVTGLLI
jgi:hypothetical protein